NVNWGRWATNSNSLPWPVSTRSITACFNWREAIAIEEWRPMRNCKRRSSRPKSMDTVRPSINTKWGPATSTMSLRLSPPVYPPPRRCEVQPNENSFIEPGRDGFVGSRRVCATEGVDQAIEFVDSDFDTPPTSSPLDVRRIYSGADLPELISAALTDSEAGGFAAECWNELGVSVRLAAERVEAKFPG